MKVIDYLNALLKIGTKIQDELEKGDPSVTILQDLYKIRSEQLDQLTIETTKQSVKELEPEEKSEVDNLFNSLRDNDKIINEKLITLSQRKERELNEINHKLKAETVYRGQQKHGHPQLLNRKLQG